MNGNAALVIYYSKTGHTARLARMIGQALGADLFQLETPRYRVPYLGYLRAGKDSLSGTLPPLRALPDLGGYDIVALGTPVWTSYPATPMRAFLATKPSLPAKTGVFVTCGDHSPPEKAYAMVRDIIGRDLSATLSLANKAEGGADEAPGIAAFCESLTRD